MQELSACSGMDSHVPGTVVGVDPRSEETPRKVEEGDGQLASLETISSLVTQLLRTVQEGRRVDDTPLPEGESGPLSAVPPGPGTGIAAGEGGGGVRKDASRLGRGRWGVSSDLTGLQMNRLFHHWGATPQRIADGMNVRCWTALKKCWEVGPQWCRSLLWGWAEVLCQWFPRCLEFVNIDGGCGLLERVGRYRSKL